MCISHLFPAPHGSNLSRVRGRRGKRGPRNLFSTAGKKKSRVAPHAITFLLFLCLGQTMKDYRFNLRVAAGVRMCHAVIRQAELEINADC